MTGGDDQASSSAGSSFADPRLSGEWIASTTSLIHDLIRLYEGAVIEDSGRAVKSVSFHPQSRLPDFPLVTRAVAQAFALHIAGEMLWRLGGEPLTAAILRAVEEHYGLPSALMATSAWADLPARACQAGSVSDLTTNR